jgi:hypothetical protein
VVGSGRIIGVVLIGLALVGLAGVAIWIFTAVNQTGSGMSGGGAGLTMGCALLFAAIVAGVGIWFFISGCSETSQFAEVEKEKQILNMVQTQGTVSIANISLETNMPLDKVKTALYDLVGKGLFTGYVDWKGGKLVSADAGKLRQQVATGTCPNCGAPQVVAGKGVIRCDYCGAEFFIPPSQQASTPPPTPAAPPPVPPTAPTPPAS